MIKIERLRKDLEDLSKIGRLPTGGVSRQTFSKADKQAREWLITKFKEAGLDTRVDEVGNIIGRMEGSGPAVICGSHLDSIPDGGFFDGVLGILAPLECVRSIKEHGYDLPAPIEIIAFSDEEERFLGFLGSYAFMGDLETMNISSIKDSSGVSLKSAMKEFDLDINSAVKAKRDPEDIKAFIEMHIEQGPILERDGCPVGVVDTIKGNYRYLVTVKGKVDHAGLPMEGRQDAMFGAVQLIHMQRDATSRHYAGGTLMTVGQINAVPGLENVVPGEVSFSVDYRSNSLNILQDIKKCLTRQMADVATELDLQIDCEPLLVIDPLPLSQHIQDLLIQAAKDLNIPWRRIQSGAGHDAQVLGAKVPTSMIFVPSVNGRSHCPEELTEWSDIEAGTNVLLKAVIALAAQEGKI
jgi:hydantoinase/carbamoylase family amidase